MHSKSQNLSTIDASKQERLIREQRRKTRWPNVSCWLVEVNARMKSHTNYIYCIHCTLSGKGGEERTGSEMKRQERTEENG